MWPRQNHKLISNRSHTPLPKMQDTRHPQSRGELDEL